MKKTLAILAIATAAAITTACDAEMEGRRMMVIDKITVQPEEWHEYKVNGGFDHFYVDKPMREITSDIFDNGAFFAYRRYNDKNQQTGELIPVQEPDGVTKTYERYEEGWIAYTETISCSYSVGNMRIELRRSDFYNKRPEEPYNFRLCIYY